MDLTNCLNLEVTIVPDENNPSIVSFNFVNLAGPVSLGTIRISKDQMRGVLESLCEVSKIIHPDLELHRDYSTKFKNNEMIISLGGV